MWYMQPIRRTSNLRETILRKREDLRKSKLLEMTEAAEQSQTEQEASSDTTLQEAASTLSTGLQALSTGLQAVDEDAETELDPQVADTNQQQMVSPRLHMTSFNFSFPALFLTHS